MEIVSSFLTYKHYRNLNLRRAWQLSGMSGTTLKVVRLVALISIFLFSFLWVPGQIRAQVEGEVEQDRTQSTATIKTLNQILAKCLGRDEGAIFIGGELHLCKAVATGIRQTDVWK